MSLEIPTPSTGITACLQCLDYPVPGFVLMGTIIIALLEMANVPKTLKVLWTFRKSIFRVEALLWLGLIGYNVRLVRFDQVEPIETYLIEKAIGKIALFSMYELPSETRLQTLKRFQFRSFKALQLRFCTSKVGTVFGRGSEDFCSSINQMSVSVSIKRNLRRLPENEVLSF